MSLSLVHVWEGSGQGDFKADDDDASSQQESGQLTEVFLCPWSQRIEGKNALLRTSHVSAMSTYGEAGNGIDGFLCTNVSFEKAGIQQGQSGPSKAYLTASFDKTKNEPGDGKSGQSNNRDFSNWVLSINLGGEVKTLAYNKWYWLKEDKKIKILRDDLAGLGKIFPAGTVSYSGIVRNIIGPPPVVNVLGKINSQDFLGFQAEQLLFLGVTLNEVGNERNELVDGEVRKVLDYECSLNFSWKPTGWNNVYIPEINDFKRIFVDIPPEKVGDPPVVRELYVKDNFEDLNANYWINTDQITVEDE